MHDLIICSEDGACRLDLLLRSLERELHGCAQLDVQVIYTYRNRWFGAAYDGVLAAHPEFGYRGEQRAGQGFRELLLASIGTHPYVSFLFDGDVLRDGLMPAAPQFAGRSFRTAEVQPLLDGAEFEDRAGLAALLAGIPSVAQTLTQAGTGPLATLSLEQLRDAGASGPGGVSAEWLNEQYLVGRRLSLATIPPAGAAQHAGHGLVWEAGTPAPGPRVSVVIPCYNAAELLPETFASVADQTLRDLEVIIVDDGSTDRSAAVAQGLVAERPDMEIRLLRRPGSGHPAHARNSGVAHARGEYILCLDADDQITPDFLERCVAALGARPEAGIAYADQQDFGGADRRHTVPEYDFNRVKRQNCFGMASVFRRAAWVDAGGFDGSGRYEDWDFWIGCGDHGHYGVKVPGIHWRYRVRSDGRFLTGGMKNDRKTKAQIVLRRPHLYSDGQRRWAQAVLAGDPAAENVADQLYVIPDVAVTTPPPPLPAHDPRTRGPGASRPLVSVIIPAFNLARWLPAAIESALDQADPGGPVEVIVVDDGSTDETPQVLASFGERIRAVRRENGGLVAAVDTGIGLARGEFIALLDADDTWPRERLRRHVGILDAHPLVGLVHGDMEVVDAAGARLHSSFFARQGLQATDGRVLGRLLANNFVSGGASTFRTALRPALHPIGPQAAYPDWWIAACVAAVAELRFDPASANIYRQHGANMGLDASADRQPGIYRHELVWRRWMLRHLTPDPVISADELRGALAAFRHSQLVGAIDRPGSVRELLEPDPVQAQAALGRLWDPVGRHPTARELIRAHALDPFDGATLIDAELALMREAGAPAPAAPPPLIALETRSAVTLAWHDEILACPALLAAYAAETRGDEETTLVVVHAPGADLAPLSALVEGDELAADANCDITVVEAPATPPADALLAARAGARLTLAGGRPGSPGARGPYAELPVHGAVERAGSQATAGTSA